MNPLPHAPTNGVENVVFSQDGKLIALGMLDGHVSIWNFASGQLLYSCREHTRAVTSLCFSHEGTWLASGGRDNLVVLYDWRTGLTKRLEGHFESIQGLAFAPQDKTLVSVSADGSIRFWSLANYQVALKLAHRSGAVNSVVFSPDGNLMATAGSDGTVRLWPAMPLDDLHDLSASKPKVNRK